MLKTTIQNKSAWPAPKPVLMDNQMITRWLSQKWSLLTSDYASTISYSTPEIHTHLGMANSIMGRLDQIWKQQRLSMQTKFRLYSSLTLSVLLYGSETWTLCMTYSDKLQAFHMMSQWRIFDIKWYDFVSNRSFKEKSALKNLPLIIADHQHAMYGHICRLFLRASAHNATQVCINTFNGKTTDVGVDAPSRSSNTDVVGLDRRGSWSSCQRRSGPDYLEIATTLSWSYASVSEWMKVNTQQRRCRRNVYWQTIPNVRTGKAPVLSVDCSNGGTTRQLVPAEWRACRPGMLVARTTGPRYSNVISCRNLNVNSAIL